MNKEKIIKSTQEQGLGAAVKYVNDTRLRNYISDINLQNERFAEAINEISKVKKFCEDPSKILGSMRTKHGEIAERMQVYFSNARNMVKGLKSEYNIDVPRMAKEDYLRNGEMVQSKFIESLNGTLEHIEKHLNKYPDFVKSNGKYNIPKDHFEKLKEISYKKNFELNRGECHTLNKLKDLESKYGLKLGEEIEPSVINYNEAQIKNVDKTVEREKSNIEEIKDSKENEIFEKSKPTVNEGLKVTAAGAVLEGGVAVYLAYRKKRKEGKKIGDFTIEDFKDLGIDLGTNSIKGGIRGGAVYVLSNFTATPANVATSLVSAMFGVASQFDEYKKGTLTKEEFAINSETMCLELSISAVAALLGQAAIPVPVVGALIGNAMGRILNDLINDMCSDSEQKIIEKYCSESFDLDKKLEEKYKEIIKMLNDKFEQFSSIIELAFDKNVNIAFEGSIELARFVGVEDEKILKTKNEIDNYFLN